MKQEENKQTMIGRHKRPYPVGPYNCTPHFLPDRGPCLYLHAGGPGNFWPACRMLTETEDEGEGSGMSVLPSAAALGCEYLISSGNPRGFDGREFER